MKKSLPVILLFWSAAYGPIPHFKVPDARPPSGYPLAVVVCEEGPGNGCRDLKKISQAVVFIDNRYAGKTDEHGSITLTVQRGSRTLYIAAVGHDGVGIQVDVRGDAHCDVELRPTRQLSHGRAEDQSFVLGSSDGTGELARTKRS
jgi:hypothetical protein